MPDRTRVHVLSADPLIEAGATGALRDSPGIEVTASIAEASVVVVVIDLIDHRALDIVRATRQAEHRPEVVLVVGELAPVEALNAIAVGARGLLRRREADQQRLVRTVFTVAAGDCAVPPDMLDGLVERSDGFGPEPGLSPGPSGGDHPELGLDERERQVLGLLAEGHETNEIARQLSYSARTVTNVIHDVIHRFRLRNRAHAVAYVLRAGLL